MSLSIVEKVAISGAVSAARAIRSCYNEAYQRGVIDGLSYALLASRVDLSDRVRCFKYLSENRLENLVLREQMLATVNP